MQKGQVKATESMIRSIFNEKELQSVCHHPFILKVLGAYQV
jgi:hypothetical protein